MHAVFFDLGGVVFSDLFSGGEVGFAQALSIAPDKLLEAYVSTDTPAYAKGQEGDEVRWRAFADKLSQTDRRLDSYLDEYRKAYQLYPAMATYLSQLAQRKDLQLGVLSDQPRVAIDYLTNAYGEVFQLFDPNLLLVSAQIGLSKKDEDLAIYKLAVQKTGLEPDLTLFVDNSLHNTENAAKIGMKTFYFDITNVPLVELIGRLDALISAWAV